MTFTNLVLNPKSVLIKNFREKLQGTLILPNDPNYDQVRAGWNLTENRFPNFIVRSASSQDVMEAVQFAKVHNLEVAIKGGGEQTKGNEVSNGGLVVDLSEMKSIIVDVDKRTAKVETGVRFDELEKTSRKYGLAAPAGVLSEIGLAGLNFGGGLSWLCRKYGLNKTLENLLAAELITAEGAQIRLSPHQHEDLYWSIRGGCDTLSIATSFELQLRKVG